MNPATWMVLAIVLAMVGFALYLWHRKTRKAARCGGCPLNSICNR